MEFNINIDLNKRENNQVSDVTIDKISKWTSIIHQILDKSHKSKSKKDIDIFPSKANPERLNFACPICGDSFKSAKKKRGNIYLHSLTYHCFNGDCLSHMNLDEFFKSFGYSGLLDGGDLARIDKFANNDIKQSLEVSNYLGIKDNLFRRSQLKQYLNFEEVELNSDLYVYLQNRKQNQNIKYFLKDKSTNNLVILNCDISGEYVLSFQVRNMNPTAENKYLTYSYAKIRTLLGLPFDESLIKIDAISQYYGILRINFRQPITVFEGPLDSFLLPNSIGLCSLYNSFLLNVKAKRYVFDNDSKARKKTLKYLNDGETVFLWEKIISELGMPKRKKWDWNDLVLWALENGKQIDVKSYFSNNKLDAIWI